MGKKNKKGTLKGQDQDPSNRTHGDSVDPVPQSGASRPTAPQASVASASTAPQASVASASTAPQTSVASTTTIPQRPNKKGTSKNQDSSNKTQGDSVDRVPQSSASKPTAPQTSVASTTTTPQRPSESSSTSSMFPSGSQPGPWGRGRGRGAPPPSSNPSLPPVGQQKSEIPEGKRKRPDHYQGRRGSEQQSGHQTGKDTFLEEKRKRDDEIPSTSSTDTTGKKQLAQPTQSLPTEKGGKGGKGKQKNTPDKPDGKGKAPSEAPIQDIVKSTQKMTVDSSMSSSLVIPKRKTPKTSHSPNTCLSKIRIEVNYLPLTFSNENLQIFHYDVTFKPDKPKSLFREALKIMRERHYPKRHPAFDGKKNLYAGGSRLNFGETLEDQVELPDREDGGRMKSFVITLKLVNSNLNFSKLKRYMQNGSSQDMPQDTIQATDIALRSHLFQNLIPCGRSFFSGPTNTDLGGGLELYNGFFQSAIMAQRPYLNVDVANKAFPIGQSVLNYLRKETKAEERDLRDGLNDQQKRQLNTFIKGLKISYEPKGIRRIYKVNGLGLNAFQHTFLLADKKQINVREYFSREMKIELQYPNLPLLHVGPALKQIMVPIELCKIIGDQVIMRKLDEKQTANMVRAAATGTEIRKRRIMDCLHNADYNRSATVNQEFGITVNTNFEQVDSWVFKPPQIQYKEGRPVEPNNGVWRMDNQHFKDSANGITSWAVLIKDQRTHVDGVRNGLVHHFMSCGREMGLNIAMPRTIHKASNFKEQSEQSILQELKMLNNNFGPLQIVIVIMSDLKDIYCNIKRASELQCGVLTQCLKNRTVNLKMNRMTAQNILLKMNAKVNGVNHELGGPLKPPVLSKPVMFVGADVTHPSPGVTDFPSIAAVAASFDRSAFKYKMIYHLQGCRKEIIEDLDEMMVEQLRHFEKMNRTLPQRILYYRDGVSEGQFTEVLRCELQAVRRACSKVRADYSPGITFLVVQKRHHTRFFPSRANGDNSRNNNVRAGTVVDTDITHPTEMDFYLVSHQSIQGTARPTKYHVLWDDNNFEGEELEMLTYYLCYLFSRCNRSVSYPAPTYYAHLGAFRARVYWEGQRIALTQLKNEQMKRGTIQSSICDTTPMFFV